MTNIKEKLVSLLSLPKEIALDLPVLMATGRNEINVENYKSLIEFSETRIRIRTKDGELAVEGQGLKLRHITTENILIYGKIAGVLYL
ncbi:MAG: sporulation protein YqfC [Defluviitaleaceae bacterium]|nr:sporulation protein YqfC [Defluviitaleaceae bacterium]